MEDDNIKDFMQKWFEQFMGRFDRLDKFMDIMSGRHNVEIPSKVTPFGQFKVTP